MKVSMTTVTMAIALLVISTATTGIPLQESTRTNPKTSADQGFFGAAGRDAPRRQNGSLQDEQVSSEKVMSQILEFINGRSESGKQTRTDPAFTDSLAENEKSQIPRRIRRTSHCRRQTDDELMGLLRSMGLANTRYADKSSERFTSLLSSDAYEELDRLTKLEIEAALRANHSMEGSLPHPHIHSIRSSLVTPEEADMPRVRRSVVGTTVSNYCVMSGQETTQGFMRMCDSCAATTELSDDLFPRYVNEVVCGSSTDCLSGGGRCSERTLSLTILSRTEHCSVASSTSPTGQVLYVEDWEPTVQRIRVACECDVSVQSVFASFV